MPGVWPGPSPGSVGPSDMAPDPEQPATVIANTMTRFTFTRLRIVMDASRSPSACSALFAAGPPCRIGHRVRLSQPRVVWASRWGVGLVVLAGAAAEGAPEQVLGGGVAGQHGVLHAIAAGGGADRAGGE